LNFELTLEKFLGIKLSLLIAKGALEAAKIPALPVDRKANMAPTARRMSPKLPAKTLAASDRGVNEGLPLTRTLSPRSPTITKVASAYSKVIIVKDNIIPRGRIRSNRESAMFQIVRKITAKELKAQPLEDELREIIRERDDISKDRFDGLIEYCKIIDIKQTMNYKEFFKLISDEISSDLNISSDNFYSQILKRENESTTVLTPFLAIPHIIIPGSNIFTVLIARSKEGIIFMEKSSKVHAVFVLAGSRNERHFHLTALAALAQIVQNSDFEKRWLSARNRESLRDIILLGRRNRTV